MQNTRLLIARSRSRPGDRHAGRGSVRDFAEAKIALACRRIDKTDRFRWSSGGDGWLGVHGITVEEEYGGAGHGLSRPLCRDGEVSRASASVGLLLRRPFEPLRQSDPPQRQNDRKSGKYLPDLISGKHVRALAMSEPGAGSDVVRCGCAPTGKASAISSTAARCGSPTACRRHAGRLRQDPAGCRGARITAFPDRQGHEGLPPGAEARQARDAAGSPTSELVSRIARCAGERAGRRRWRRRRLDERARLRARGLGRRAARIMQACLDVVIPYIHDRKAIRPADPASSS